jgi:hypothetical protein
VGGALFHDDGGGAGDEGFAAVWGFREIRRWSGERGPGAAGAGEVYDLQAAQWGVQLECDGAQRKKYEPGSVDFFAVLLIPRDDWYIIPFEVMGRTNCSLHFTPKSKRQKYGEYWEAWDLLRDEGLTIQACGDEKWAEVIARTADSSLRSE